MCNWCEKETKGTPQPSGAKMPMICEHCGTKIGDFGWKELKKWKEGNTIKAAKGNPGDVGY